MYKLIEATRKTENLRMLLGATLSVVIGIVFAYNLYSLTSKIQASTLAAAQGIENRIKQLETSISDIAREEQTIRQYIDQYFTIVRSGVLKSENRLQILQTLDQLRTDIGLAPLSVSIDNQSSMDLRNRFNLTEVGYPILVSSSRLNVRFSLSHEEQLVRFLLGFRDTGNLSIIEKCTLEDEQPGNSEVNSIKSECVINWITFNLAENSLADF